MGSLTPVGQGGRGRGQVASLAPAGQGSRGQGAGAVLHPAERQQLKHN